VRVSIVTTCLNAATTIRETIDSVLSQQGDFTIEYIITDAGSSDDTLKIIAEYGDAIRLVDAHGLNQSQGINLGLRMATGDILAFLNADDVYLSGALQRVVDAFRADLQAQWLVGGCYIIDEHGKGMHSFVTSYKEFLRKRYSYFLLLTENFICQPAVFFRRTAFLEAGDFDENENYVMDYEYWLRLGKKYPPQNLFQPLAAFRRMAQTKSNTHFVKQFCDDVRVGVMYACKSRRYAAIPIKLFNFIKTVSIYSFLYR
jgi:glycosyltransferase involved in cell wall biosynthesis